MEVQHGNPSLQSPSFRHGWPNSPFPGVTSAQLFPPLPPSPPAPPVPPVPPPRPRSQVPPPETHSQKHSDSPPGNGLLHPADATSEAPLQICFSQYCWHRGPSVNEFSQNRESGQVVGQPIAAKPARHTTLRANVFMTLLRGQAACQPLVCKPLPREPTEARETPSSMPAAVARATRSTNALRGGATVRTQGDHSHYGKQTRLVPGTNPTRCYAGSSVIAPVRITTG